LRRVLIEEVGSSFGALCFNLKFDSLVCRRVTFLTKTRSRANDLLGRARRRLSNVDAIDRLWHFDAFRIEGGLHQSNAFALRLEEVRARLIDPGMETDRDARSPELLDQSKRGRLIDHRIHLGQGLASKLLSADQVFVYADLEDEVELPQGIARVVEQHRLEDLGIRDAEMIAFERQ